MKLTKTLPALCLAVLLGSAAAAEAQAGPDIQQSIDQAQALSNAFTHVAALVTPSVVNISAVKRAKPPQMRQMPRGRQSDPFRDFFGEDFFEKFFSDRMPQEGQKQMSGMGSGFIIDEQGHILTNDHVVSEADEVMVRLNDNRTFKAEVVGSDPGTDLAVIRIKNAGKLVPLKLGDSDKLRVGEWVVAVGNPFALDHTITTGIVSAKGRAITPGGMKYEDFIQTDAAITPGNSGGPLVNLYGEVVGINSAIFTRSGGYMGIGFAIPVNLAKTGLDSLLKHGHVGRGGLGVAIQDVTEQLAESFDFEGTEGALVGDVTKDGPAERAGIRSGDIIVQYDGKPVKDVNQLRFAVAATVPGSTVDVEVVRGGEKQTIKVKVGELKGKAEARPDEDRSSEDLGLKVQTLTPELKGRLGIESAGSVIVTEVSPFSLAANAGLQENDIIVSVAGKQVESASEFLDEVKRHDLKKGVRQVVETGGMKRFIILRSTD